MVLVFSCKIFLQAGKQSFGKLCELGDSFNDSDDDNDNNDDDIDINHDDNDHKNDEIDNNNNDDNDNSNAACKHPELDLCPVESNPKLGNATRQVDATGQKEVDANL